MLISQKKYDELKYKDLVPLKCKCCDKIFNIPKSKARNSFNPNHPAKYNFCSRKCGASNKNTKFSIEKIQELQKFYDDNHNLKQSVKQFKTSLSTLSILAKKGLFKTRSLSEASKLSRKLHPHRHSKETKEKMSKAKIKFLLENPDKHPYLLHHSSNGDSYAEKYFKKTFEHHTNIQHKFRILTYELDFADVKNKIDIEIDGNQHFSDPRIVKHDIKRNKTLQKLGYTIIRINWSKYSKLSRTDKETVVQDIINYRPSNFECLLFLCPINDNL